MPAVAAVALAPLRAVLAAALLLLLLFLPQHQRILQRALLGLVELGLVELLPLLPLLKGPN